MKTRKCGQVQPLLCNLHWLPVHSRIDNKILTLCFNAFNNSSLVYIAQLLSVYTPSRCLHSSSYTCTLHIPFIKTKSFGQRAFSFTGPTQWNLLPYGLQHSESSPAFKTALKTHLFRSSNLLYLLDAVCVCVCVCVCVYVCLCVCL